MLNPKIFIGLLIAAFVFWGSTFVVNERELAVTLKYGKIYRTDYAPGLHFKVPVIMEVRKFDKRLLNLDGDAQRFLTKEKKDVIVDSYARWQIDNVDKYYRATGGDENRAIELLQSSINSKLREEFGKRTIDDVVSGERGAVMGIVTRAAGESGKDIGAKIVDVRIKRIDLPPEVSASVFGRMRAERERVARDLRSRGDEAAEKIRADADRERTVLLAEAYRDAETLRGEGDARAAEIYSGAYDADREFYSFYRSLAAYRAGFAGKDDVLVLQPDSDFFKFFNQPHSPAAANTP
ncbi:MAG: protease modulator HflC [Gammaproteobacteria bacterium]